MANSALSCPIPSCKLRCAGCCAGALLLLGGLGGTALADRSLAVTATVAGPARVIDGDTIEISGERIRLEGIDAPETAQTCTSAAGLTWACGQEAGKVLRALTSGSDVACDSRGRDKYGRTLAICYSGGIDLNGQMVRSGYAWAFVKYSTEYVAAETQARAGKAGVWQGAAQAPWDFRHGEWQVAETTAPGGCAIKGNISGHGHIYHVPWGPWYDKVSVNEARGERWFCSEADAMAAGWRAAMPN